VENKVNPPKTKGQTKIPDSAMLRESMEYIGPPYPMFEFLPYKKKYICRTYALEKIPAHIVGNQRGYFRALEYPMHPITRIHERVDGKWLLWMSNTEMEIHSHMAHVENAHGVTVVCGLGIGMVAYAFAQRPEVQKVYVIERNPFLHHHFYRMLEFIPPEWEERVVILPGDVLTDQFDLPPVDFMYCDTWEEMMSSKGLVHTTRAYNNLLINQKPTAVGMWGQELEYILWCSNNGRPDWENEDRFREFIHVTGIPFRMGLPSWDEYFDTIRAAGLAQAAQVGGYFEPRG
jgi:hypothetical protein